MLCDAPLSQANQHLRAERPLLDEGFLDARGELLPPSYAKAAWAMGTPPGGLFAQSPFHSRS